MAKSRRRFDMEAGKGNSPEAYLRQAVRAHIHASIQLYLEMEGKVSVSRYEHFGDTANMVCSLGRAMGHLLKLQLMKTDPMLLYPFSKDVEEYCHIRRIRTRRDKEIAERVRQKQMLAHTVDFKEALKRVELTLCEVDFDFTHFSRVYALRNSLEHHWDRNEELLQAVVGEISATIIPRLRDYIGLVLEEDPDDYFDKDLLEEVDRLDRAILQGRSLELQRRVEEHQRLYWDYGDEACRKALKYPDKYEHLDETDTDAKCPVCDTELSALYDLEPDYDVEGSRGEAYIVGLYPDVKCLHCEGCHFFIEGKDVGTFLPNGLDKDWEELLGIADREEEWYWQ